MGQPARRRRVNAVGLWVEIAWPDRVRGEGSQKVTAKKDNPTHIKDLVPDPTNRRKHTPRNVGMIVDALHKVGAGRSIVIDETNTVLAGNATLEAAGEAGITDLRVIEAKGSELVAVRRTGLSAAQKRDLALYDNRTGELAEWDVDQLMSDVDEGLNLSEFFFDDELERLVAPTEIEVNDPQREIDGAFDFLDFKCGDVSGRISSKVYDSFKKAYDIKRSESDEVLMDDVLIEWLGL